MILLSVGANAQSVQEGEGRFFSKDEDNLVFIKQQLLYQSFKQILTKEMDTLGLDSKAFWQRYEDQFENYFKPIEDTLKEKVKPEESAKNRADFEKSLRTQKLNAQARYGRIQRAIQSYSIKKMSRSPQVPNSRFMNVEAKVDRKNLTDLYMSFIKSGAKQGFTKLYLMTDFQLVNSTWSDTGVDLESDFTSVVNDHWKKWLLESGGVGLSEVIIADNSLISQFENRIHHSENLATEQNEAGELWLKVNLRLNKTNEDNVLQKRTFHVTGEYVLIDSQNNYVLDKGDFPTEVGAFSTQDLHQFSSQLASMIYRMPVNFWGKFSQIISAPIPSQFLKIKVTNIKNVSDAIAISDLINQIGVVKKATAGLIRLRGNEAEIGIRFFGDGSEMLNMLKGLVGREIQNQVIKGIENAGPLDWSLSPLQEIPQDKTKSST